MQHVLDRDAQSVKNTETARLKGEDAYKKILGLNRHVAVDTQGVRETWGEPSCVEMAKRSELHKSK